MSRINTEEMADIMKGPANHYRIEILLLFKKHRTLTLEVVCAELKANYKTIAAHLSRLSRSGLITKKYKGLTVEHQLTKRGHSILNFLRNLE